MATGRRKPDPDRILCARLSGTAIRLARAGGPIDEAVTALRALAGSRGDLLAEKAAIMAACVVGSCRQRRSPANRGACSCWPVPTMTSSRVGLRSAARG